MGAICKVYLAGFCGAFWLSLQWMTLGSIAAAETEPNMLTKCKGDNLVLNEPNHEVIPRHVFVFRNGESVASTSAAASGDLRSRLLVDTDARVRLSNLSTNDLGVYRVEVRLANGKILQQAFRLLVEEPPRTAGGKLDVQSESLNDSFVRLRCGAFISLGYPPVSVSWKDSSGQLLGSTGFSQRHFELDLPAAVARYGRYCCQLLCRAPNYCCLDDQSPLRQCAQVDVQAVSKEEEGQTTTEGGSAARAAADVSGLERRISAMESLLQDSPKSAAMAQGKHCPASCDQLEAIVHRLDATELAFQAGVAEVRSIKDEVQSQADALQRATEDFRSRIPEEVARLNSSLIEAGLWSAEEMAILNATLRDYFSRQQAAEERVLKIDSRYAEVREWLLNAHTWISKMLHQMKQVTTNMTSVGDGLADLQRRTKRQLAELNHDLKSMHSTVEALVNTVNETHIGVQANISALASLLQRPKYGGCPVEKGYLLYGQRCLKLYAKKQDYQSARSRCEADGAHLFHFKSRDNDGQPLLDLLDTHGKRLGQHAKSGLWVGADKMLDGGAFTWSDRAIVPLGSDLRGLGKPDDGRKKEKCVQIRFSRGFALSDESCHLTLESVCQADIETQ